VAGMDNRTLRRIKGRLIDSLHDRPTSTSPVSSIDSFPQATMPRHLEFCPSYSLLRHRKISPLRRTLYPATN
jgi:hypothetical protein